LSKKASPVWEALPGKYGPFVGFHPVESEQIVIDCLLESDDTCTKMNKPSSWRCFIHPAFTPSGYITSEAHTGTGEMQAERGGGGA
jgi:hypothetical protein